MGGCDAPGADRHEAREERETCTQGVGRRKRGLPAHRQAALDKLAEFSSRPSLDEERMVAGLAFWSGWLDSQGEEAGRPRDGLRGEHHRLRQLQPYQVTDVRPDEGLRLIDLWTGEQVCNRPRVEAASATPTSTVTTTAATPGSRTHRVPAGPRPVRPGRGAARFETRSEKRVERGRQFLSLVGEAVQFRLVELEGPERAMERRGRPRNARPPMRCLRRSRRRWWASITRSRSGLAGRPASDGPPEAARSAVGQLVGLLRVREHVRARASGGPPRHDSMDAGRAGARGRAPARPPECSGRVTDRYAGPPRGHRGSPRRRWVDRCGTACRPRRSTTQGSRPGAIRPLDLFLAAGAFVVHFWCPCWSGASAESGGPTRSSGSRRVLSDLPLPRFSHDLASATPGQAPR